MERNGELMLQPEKARFIECKASAGSGKTYQLALTYLALAFAADNDEGLKNRFKRILAITFTNAAVNEMKKRIVEELDALCDDEREGRPAMEESLVKATGLTAEEVRRRAKVVYKSVLHNYSDLAVCTIDSFAHRIVKTFAHDMKLPEDFEITLDKKELQERVTDNLMALIGTDGEEELTRLMQTYSEERMRDEKSYDIEGGVKEMVGQVLEEDTPKYIKELGEWNLEEYLRLKRKYNEDNARFEAEVAKLGEEGLRLIAEKGIGEDMFHRGAASAPSYFKKAKNKDFSAATKTAKEFFEGEKTAAVKCDATTRAAIEELKPKLTEIYGKIERKKAEGLRLYNSRRRLMARLYEIGLLKRLSELVERYYQDNKLLHMSEITKQIAEVVGLGDAPFIYERIGNRYQNILIDEFQDTSRQQWVNLLPLVENAVANNHTTLVVGDAKQSIYRFRGGDVRQFLELPNVRDYGYLNIGKEGIYTPFPKKKNWRSKKVVVAFNNEYFSKAIRDGFGDNEYLTEMYIGQKGDGEEDLRQEWKKSEGEPQGFVKLDFREESEGMWEAIGDEVEAQHGKGYEYGEICVMASKHDQLTKVSEVLTKRGIKIESSESQKLENSHLVRLVLATMRCVMNPKDQKATLTALIELEYMGKIGRSYVAEAVKNKTWKRLDEMTRAAGIELDFERMRQMSLYDCCEETIRKYNSDGKENAYASKLLNVTAEYAQTHRQDLREFLEWMDSHMEDMKLACTGGSEAVPLRTIHTAKGLQWKVVIVALPSSRGRNNPIWVEVKEPELELKVGLTQSSAKEETVFDEQFDEERKLREMDNTNMVYVALTRPEEKLIVYASCKKSEKEAKSHQQLLWNLAKDIDIKDTAKEVRQTESGEQYLFGEDHEREAKKSEEEKERIVTLENISFPSYAERIRYARHANEEATTSKEQEFGTLVHETLAMTDHAGDVERAVERQAKRQKLDEETKERVRQMAEQAVNGEESRRFFAKGLKVRKETSLMFNGKELRPDRIVFADGETWVVDFKTGAEHESYKSQVQGYCEAMEAMGYPKVKGYLMYLNETGCEVVEV
ncbi:MAG: UvrD-helicase domain-containing protein [Bacteroidales bacterium]|nr:UvrD-helicase domain-containing protein [Bacteroidales bacterium]